QGKGKACENTASRMKGRRVARRTRAWFCELTRHEGEHEAGKPVARTDARRASRIPAAAVTESSAPRKFVSRSRRAARSRQRGRSPPCRGAPESPPHPGDDTAHPSARYRAPDP